jgi:prepilin peptidase CpaA
MLRLLTAMDVYLAIGVMVCAGIAAAVDVQRGRIPNWLTYTAIAVGLASRAFSGSWRSFLDGLSAGLIGGGIFFIFFLVRGMGAGDVKLMAAVGVWSGLRQLPAVMIATALAGGILALGMMLVHKRASTTLRNVGSLFRFHVMSGLAPHPEINLQNPQALRLPYALAIAAGTIYVHGVSLMRG